MPFLFGAIVLVVIKSLAKLFVGAATAGLVYYFLTSVAQPKLDYYSDQILQKVNELSTVGGTAMEVIIYLDFPQCVSILLTASATCFSLKIMSVAVRAFGITTG